MMACGTSPTMVELETARAAYRDLIMGNKPRVVVDQNGERVEFVAANAPRLYAYIQQMEQVLCPAASPRPNRPMGFLF